MALDTFANFGSGASGAGDAFESITGGLQNLFGSGGSQQQSGQQHNVGRQRGTGKQHRRGARRLEISDAAIQKIIQDMLQETDGGLAAIFGGEKRSGLYNSSVAAEEAGDLAAKILGEVGKLRATEKYDDKVSEVTTGNQMTHSQTEAETETDTEGLLDGLF